MGIRIYSLLFLVSVFFFNYSFYFNRNIIFWVKSLLNFSKYFFSFLDLNSFYANVRRPVHFTEKSLPSCQKKLVIQFPKYSSYVQKSV